MQIVTALYHLKVHLESWTGQSHGLLAIHAGLIIYLLCQLAMGTRRGTWLALVIVAIASAFNAVINGLYFGTAHLGEVIGNFILVLLWPALLTATSQYRRWRWNVHNNRIKRRRKFGQHMPAAVLVPVAPAPAQPTRRPHLRLVPGHGPNRAQA